MTENNSFSDRQWQELQESKQRLILIEKVPELQRFLDIEDYENLKDLLFKLNTTISVLTKETLTDKIKEWIEESDGYFSVSDLYRELAIRHTKDKTNVRQVVHKMVQDNLLEKFGQKNHQYRKKQTILIPIDYMNVEAREATLKWPLGIEDLFVTYPANLIIVAGTKDSGKTAFLLDFIKKNQDYGTINYFPNEFAGEELNARLSMHQDMLITDWKFKCFEPTQHPEDMIQPDEINVIDYLEINDKFFQVADKLTKMADKLEKGVLVVALQKARGAMLGRGSDFSWERCRLYITLERGLAKILSAKNWRDHYKNPVGLVSNYKLVGGWKIIGDPWHSETDDKTIKPYVPGEYQ